MSPCVPRHPIKNPISLSLSSQLHKTLLPASFDKSSKSASPAHSVHQKPEKLNVHPKLTAKQLEALRELPPVCISDLPGLMQAQPEQQETKPSSQVRLVSGEQEVSYQELVPSLSPAQSNTQQQNTRHQNNQQNKFAPQQSRPVQTRNTRPQQRQQPVQERNVHNQPQQRQYQPNVSNPYAKQPVQFQNQQPRRAGQGQPIRSTYQAGHLSPNALASYNPHKNATAQSRKAKAKARNAAYVKKVQAQLASHVPKGADPHAGAFSRSLYPSADECRACHQQIYEEWASSSHAYASISPMFHRFEDTINRLAQGTLGYFCLRCHAPVATTMKLRRDQAIWDGPKVFREGVTCVACHRVKESYNKMDGERRMEPGDIYSPVYGSTDGTGVEKAIKYGGYFKTKTDPKQKGPGQAIHRRAIKFEQLSKSSFCMSCHQVAVKPGIKLEVVWEQYRASPAFRQGVTCQDCHMGKVPGRNEGYTVGPAAVIGGKVVNPDRKHSNHLFYGPGYSIAHPGIFPQTVEGNRWTVNEWLQFNWRAGWGTDAFEDALAAGKITCYFPPAWREVDDRYDARDIVDANLKKLAYKKEIRKQLFENSSRIDGPYFTTPRRVGKQLKFYYCLSNLNNGHNMPSGSLGAQPQLWLNVVLIGPDGGRLWESGYLDSIGDLADLQSLDVQKRRVPFDKQLFNLQTKFLTTNVKGTDREMPLPVNVDFDQLPFIRPAAQPTSVINHPPFIRMEGHSLPPLGKRKAKYIVPAHLIQSPGTYRLSIRMRSRAEPIYFMRFVKATAEMERMMNEWICDSHAYTVTFEVK